MKKDDAVKILTEKHQMVLAAIAERDLFIEQNKHMFAEFEIGQRVRNSENGTVGVVTGHYHHTYGHPENQLFYEEFNIHCRIEYISMLGVTRETNTSRDANHPWITFIE